MRYKEYVWPHNPRVYSIDYERIMAVNKVPFGLYYLQDLGRTRRVMKGEGEFIGEDAYTQFGQLANVFYSGGPGQLIHPLWQTANAYFVSLRLEQEPMRDYVRYSFEFWEEANYYSGQVRTWTAQTSQSSGSDQAAQAIPIYYQVVKGDTLWSIAMRYGMALSDLIALNPQIKNPNLIHIGDEVRVS
ncbi:LysM peptidoglycan-binding domain-containing protein [Flintibacter sp.]|uniref:LysM peptidoglycan-binding domain-containing protein n=1 Tax=Flintibacter sp. TaxID=1918624 RepID=UPI003A163B3A